MRFRKLPLFFCVACLGLVLLVRTAPLAAEASARLEAAITQHGAQLYLRLGETTFAFDRGLLSFLADKWHTLCTTSLCLLPPGAAAAADAVVKTICDVLRALIG